MVVAHIALNTRKHNMWCFPLCNFNDHYLKTYTKFDLWLKFYVVIEVLNMQWLQVDYLRGDAGSIDIDGSSFSLVQIHWHWPSEHTIDGRRLINFPSQSLIVLFLLKYKNIINSSYKALWSRTWLRQEHI